MSASPSSVSSVYDGKLKKRLLFLSLYLHLCQYFCSWFSTEQLRYYTYMIFGTLRNFGVISIFSEPITFNYQKHALHMLHKLLTRATTVVRVNNIYFIKFRTETILMVKNARIAPTE